MIRPDLPLIDLHRHLDGSVRLETILDVGLQHNLPLPARDLEGLRPFVQVTTPVPGLLAFLEKFEWMVGILVNYDVCRRIAYENVQDAQREGIDYIELRFSPMFMAQPHGLDPAGIVEAVADGVAAGQRDFGVRTNLIGIISRTFGADMGWQELEALLSQRDHLVALDLAGDEVNFPGELFVEHFKRGRDAGWEITVHAGEAGGSTAVWQALRELEAKRIGHAVRAVDDSALMDYLAENRIGVEMNLTSNVQTSTVPDYASHPLKTMLEHNILATINSDDPGISNIDLPFEYKVAVEKAGLTQQQANQAQQNALDLAYLSPAEKAVLLSRKQAS
ncbi:MAG: adenosine deaminase [Anaerolineales bacterium]|nr:adenosine deaminase [Anaerolineales bacterium]MCB8939904.1 adenosine deaminase [Ardenticatenaceae bacterium]